MKKGKNKSMTDNQLIQELKIQFGVYDYHDFEEELNIPSNYWHSGSLNCLLCEAEKRKIDITKFLM